MFRQFALLLALWSSAAVAAAKTYVAVFDTPLRRASTYARVTVTEVPAAGNTPASTTISGVARAVGRAFRFNGAVVNNSFVQTFPTECPDEAGNPIQGELEVSIGTGTTVDITLTFTPDGAPVAPEAVEEEGEGDGEGEEEDPTGLNTKAEQLDIPAAQTSATAKKFTVLFPAFDPAADEPARPAQEKVHISSKLAPKPKALAGSGWASIKIAVNGVATVLGRLPDGTFLSYSGPLSATDKLPIHIFASPALPKPAGSDFAPARAVFGGIVTIGTQEEFEDADAYGTFRWTRPAAKGAQAFRNGFAVIQGGIGYTYEPHPHAPHPITLLPQKGNKSIVEIGPLGVFHGIDTTGYLFDRSTISPALGMSMRFDVGKGVFVGSMTHPNLKLHLPASGIVIQPKNQIEGLIASPYGTTELIISAQTK